MESYPKDIRVVVMGTGGLSHQLQGPRFGFVNRDWDNEFLDRLEADPEPLATLSHRDYMERGGTEGIEMINWLADAIRARPDGEARGSGPITRR